MLEISHRPKSAIDKTNSTLEESPKVNSTVGTLLLNAQILRQHREHRLALNLLRQACNLDSYNLIVLKELYSCLIQIENFKESLIVAKTILKLEYTFENIFNYAQNYYRLGDDGTAMQLYYEALSVVEIDSKLVFELYKNLGNILVRQRDFDGAEEYYNKAYTINNHSDVLLVNLGTLEVQKSDFDKALYCFRQAVDVNPLNDKAWAGLAMIHNQYSDFELAWANIVRSIDQNPNNRTALIIAANWALRDQKQNLVIKQIESYLSKEEFDQDLSLVLINLYCSSGLLQKAVVEVERFLCWHPENTEVLNLKMKLGQLL